MDEPKEGDAMEPDVEAKSGATTVRSLTEILGKTIEETVAGKCSAENANAIAKLAAQMNNLLRTGLDAMRLHKELTGAASSADPVALVLGEKK